MILLGLGSNMGEREQNLLQALRLLDTEESVRIKQVSFIYETAPFGVTDQADFLNMVARVETSLSPGKLLDKCLEVETSMGRIRTRHWGPRIIDIDLLIYNNVRQQDDILTLPHPGMEQRAFVLIPLRDVAPGFQLPNGRTVEHQAAEILKTGGQEVRLWKKIYWDSSSKCFV